MVENSSHLKVTQEKKLPQPVSTITNISILILKHILKQLTLSYYSTTNLFTPLKKNLFPRANILNPLRMTKYFMTCRNYDTMLQKNLRTKKGGVILEIKKNY